MRVTVGRPWEACSKELGRPILTAVWFDAEAATLTATDSYVAVRVPCEVEDGDESGLVPAAAFKVAAAQSARALPRLRVAGGKVSVALADRSERTWPLLEGTFPNVEVYLGAPTGRAFGVNPELVAKLGAAFAAGGKRGGPLRLYPVSPVKPMRVAFGPDETEGVGVLMPVRLGRDDGAVLADYDDDGAVLAGIEAAARALGRRRGKKAALAAFRGAVAAASQPAEEVMPS